MSIFLTLPVVRLATTTSQPDTVLGTCTVRVINAGGPSGAQSVLLFARHPVAMHHSALRQKLIAFEKVAAVEAGESRLVHFAVKAEHLLWPGRDGTRSVAVGEYELIVRDGANELKQTIRVA